MWTAEVNRTLRYDGPQSSVTNPAGIKHISLENLVVTLGEVTANE